MCHTPLLTRRVRRVQEIRRVAAKFFLLTSLSRQPRGPSLVPALSVLLRGGRRLRLSGKALKVCYGD
jgi:hypothetical protein